MIALTYDFLFFYEPKLLKNGGDFKITHKHLLVMIDQQTNK